MKRTKGYKFLAVLFLSIAFISCTEKPAGVVRLMSEGSLENVITQNAEIYKLLYPNITLNYSFSTDDNIIDSLVNDKANVIITSRKLTDEELSKAKENKLNVRTNLLAVDGVALIVNNANTCKSLTVSDIKDIMSGKTKSWKDLSKSKLGDINIIFDKGGYSNYQFIKDSVLHADITAKNVIFEDNYKKLIERVKKDESAIGVLSVSSFATDENFGTMTLQEKSNSLRNQKNTANIKFPDDFKVLGVCETKTSNVFKPYSAYFIKDLIELGRYPLRRDYYISTTAMAATSANAFSRFMLEFDGQQILGFLGLLPSSLIKNK